MTAFRFRLDKVLAWRRSQLEVEEARYRQCLAAIAALDRARAELEASGIQAETQVRKWHPVAGSDLSALDSFRRGIRTRESNIAERRAESVKMAEKQLKTVLEAQRRCRLLDRLRERRREEWTKANDRELEEVATESFLARRIADR